MGVSQHLPICLALYARLRGVREEFAQVKFGFDVRELLPVYSDMAIASTPLSSKRGGLYVAYDLEFLSESTVRRSTYE